MGRLILAIAVATALASQAHAADPRFPDWPCVQIKVPDISLAAVWAGPAIDDVGDRWQRDPKVHDLVTRIAPRRTPLEDAEKMIAEAVTGSAAEKQDKAKLLFAGLLDTLNRERATVMSGIERSFRKQRTVADRVRADVLKLRTLQDAADRDESKINELTEQLAWETRIFEDRQKAIGYVCEVPVQIERRLFALGRAIQQALE